MYAGLDYRIHFETIVVQCVFFGIRGLNVYVLSVFGIRQIFLCDKAVKEPAFTRPGFQGLTEVI